MNKKIKVDIYQCQNVAAQIADELIMNYSEFRNSSIKVYGIPRGGIPAAMMVVDALKDRRRCAKPIELTDNVAEADLIVDDLVDSGATRDRVLADLNNMTTDRDRVVFRALFDKTGQTNPPWFIFPWENSEENSITDNIVRILQYIGEDPNRDGLKDTPRRVIKSYAELFEGYSQDPASLMTTFDESCNEMVILRNIEFTSFCEHHMLPFIGRAHIGYIPNGKVIGISKLARLLDVYAHRLQIQERIGTQVTKALDDHLKPLGSACVIEAKHTCMSCRGVGKQHSEMITSSLTGVFLDKDTPGPRQEFMSLIRS